VTLCYPLLYGLGAAPSKEAGGTLEKGTDACSTPAQEDAVTPDQRGASPPSPSVLCGHPRHRNAIPSTAAPSPTLWEYEATRHCHVGCCAPYTPPPVSCTLESVYERQLNEKFLHHYPLSRSWTDTGHATTPARSKIRRDDRLVHDVVRHTATRI
jgi:hypothetical protein